MRHIGLSPVPADFCLHVGLLRAGIFVAGIFVAGLFVAGLLTGCKPEMPSNGDQVTHGTHLVLLESGIHWAEWLKADNSDCGDIYKWNDVWIADTYPRGGLQQHPFDTKDEAISYVQKFCQ